MRSASAKPASRSPFVISYRANAFSAARRSRTGASGSVRRWIAARAARAAIHLRTEPLPPVLDLLAAEKAFARYEITKGDLEAGFAEADRIVEGTYRVGPQEHIY